jgi:hypothetical protein
LWAATMPGTSALNCSEQTGTCGNAIIEAM